MAWHVAHLGPAGTNSETVAHQYGKQWQAIHGQEVIYVPRASIGKTLDAVTQKQVEIAIVPVENSTEGSVAVTLDGLWAADSLQIQQELVSPIVHMLVSQGETLGQIKRVLSHPQALGQCQRWLVKNLPDTRILPTNSTSEAIQLIQSDPTAAAIASPRAASLYRIPTLVANIQDYAENWTRFWAIGNHPSEAGSHTTLGFSVEKNQPGILVQPLQVLAKRGINLSRIESRPTKRYLGEYLFFMDVEASLEDPLLQEALEELQGYTETIKIFGSYPTQILNSSDISKQGLRILKTSRNEVG